MVSAKANVSSIMSVCLILVFFAVGVKAETVFQTFDADPMTDSNNWKVNETGTGKTGFAYNPRGYLDVKIYKEPLHSARYGKSLSKTYDKQTEFWWEGDIQLLRSATAIWPYALFGVFNTSGANQTNAIADRFPYVPHNRHYLVIYDAQGVETRFTFTSDGTGVIEDIAPDTCFRVKGHYWFSGSTGYAKLDMYEIKSGNLVASTGVKTMISTGKKVTFDFFGIGNRSDGRANERGIELRVDNIYFSTESPNTKNILPSFMFSPDADRIISISDEAGKMLNEGKFKAAEDFLENAIGKYKSWREINFDNSAEVDSVAPVLYFKLAKAKQQTGASKERLAELYKQTVKVPTLNIAMEQSFAFVWLFDNSSIEDFNGIVKDFVRNKNIKAVATAMVKGFEAENNWKAFEAFLNILFARADQPVETAKSIGSVFESNSQWARSYFSYCLNKPQLTEYAFHDKIELADRNISMNKMDEAAEIYKELLNKCGPNQDKSVLELKLCQCFVSAGKYEQAISELDKLITNYKMTSRGNVKRAILMKGQCYIQMGQLDRATDVFLSIIVEYPEAQEAPEANFFVGYSKMLGGKFDDAKGIFNSLIHDFPTSDFVSKAKQCLERIERLAK